MGILELSEGLRINILITAGYVKGLRDPCQDMIKVEETACEYP